MTEDARDLEAARQIGCRSGDGVGASAEANAAFARIYDRHAPVVLALCRKHAPSGGGGRGSRGGDADADDALQETFIRAFRMLDRLTNPDGMRAWLYAIARNVCAERRRAARRRTHHEHEAVNRLRERPTAAGPAGNSAHPTAWRPDADNHSLDPQQAAEHSEQLSKLTRALDALPDDERTAVHLYYLDPDPVNAAKSALGLSRSGFYKLLARARERLATLMTEVTA